MFDAAVALLALAHHNLAPMIWAGLWFAIGWVCCWALNPWELKK